MKEINLDYLKNNDYIVVTLEDWFGSDHIPVPSYPIFVFDGNKLSCVWAGYNLERKSLFNKDKVRFTKDAKVYLRKQLIKETLKNG